MINELRNIEEIMCDVESVSGLVMRFLVLYRRNINAHSLDFNGLFN